MTLSPLVPRAILFGNPTHFSPAIAPNGVHCAYLAALDGVLNIWVGTRRGVDFHPVTADRHRGISAFTWAHDGRHLLYAQDREGDENTHLYAVDLATGTTRDLTPFKNVQARFVATDKRFPQRLMVALNTRSPELHDVYRLDIATGELALAARNAGFASWLVDSELEVRGAVAWRPDGGASIMVRDDESADWRPVHVVGHEDAITTRPIAFADDGRSLLLVSSLGANTARLVRLDLVGGSVEVLFEDPEHDVVSVTTHPESRRPQIGVVERARAHMEVLDPTIAEDVRRIMALGRGDASLLGRDHADRVWLVQLNADDRPAAYYAYDRRARRADFLFTHMPEVDRYTLAHIEPFSFVSRDGLTINGYLTFPPGSQRRLLPTVLAVHGGPWSRDLWGFRGEPQWLANRGYLCLQVNFRGSTGYGKDFANAGDRQWGARMQDDLIDAVDHVVRRGFADPRRIGIYGASYGGYAALVGATFTPDVFRCAISMAGPSNLKTFTESISPRLYSRIGDPMADAEALLSRSPLSRADQIRIPILIAQGANDPRVRRAESEQIVSAMRLKGIPHVYLLFEDEGHTLVRPENRLKFYAEVEHFLAEHLGGRCEPRTEAA